MKEKLETSILLNLSLEKNTLLISHVLRDLAKISTISQDHI